MALARAPHKVLVQLAKDAVDDVMGDCSVTPREARTSLLELVDHLQICVDELGETESK